LSNGATLSATSVTNDPAGTISVTGSDTSLEAHGDVSNKGKMSVSNGGQVDVAGTLTSSGQLQSSGPGSSVNTGNLRNSGDLSVGDGSGLNVGDTLTNTGSVEVSGPDTKVNTGTYNTGQGSKTTLGDGSQLNADVIQQNGGSIIDPNKGLKGGSTIVTGELVVGADGGNQSSILSLSNVVFQSTASLKIDLFVGGDYDQLYVQNVTFGGTLVINLVGNVDLKGLVLDVVEYGTFLGSFDNSMLSGLPACIIGQVDTTYTTTSLQASPSASLDTSTACVYGNQIGNEKASAHHKSSNKAAAIAAPIVVIFVVGAVVALGLLYWFKIRTGELHIPKFHPFRSPASDDVPMEKVHSQP